MFLTSPFIDQAHFTRINSHSSLMIKNSSSCKICDYIVYFAYVDSTRS